MNRFRAYAVSGILLALPLAAQPVVNVIENNYSYIPAGLPSYGIAQGSIFAIFGTNLTQTPSGLQSVPLQTTLNGVTVQFSVQGTTTEALLYYVTPGQIGGILPSATPVGTGTVTVTSGGQSGSAPVTVVQSAVGILTVVIGPLAPAWAMDGSHQLLPGIYAANPGETLTFYGTGAGPVTDDESVAQTPENLSNIPLEIDIGGVSATVTYHGRSTYPGLDQFNVVVPPGPTGCNVSVTARSGSYLSNSVLIPVAASGRTCSDPADGIPGLSAPSTSGSLTIGNLALVSLETIQASGTGVLQTMFDSGSGYFQQLTVPPGATVEIGGATAFPSVGSCTVYGYEVPVAPPPIIQPATLPALLNAGPALNFYGPNGFSALPVRPGQTGYYSGPLSLSTGQMVIPNGGGTFTINNGSGGPDIGAFQTKVNFPPLLMLSNAGAIAGGIDRSQPLTLQWSGGNTSGYLAIVGHSQLPVSNGEQIGATFQCTAPVSTGQFTIPASILGALPAQAAVPGTPGSPVLEVASTSTQAFTAPGMDLGEVALSSVVEIEVGYQ